MTIEELKDLIDSTINENGTKAITGKALNLALNEITNAVAEAATTGGGGGVKRLYADINGGSVTAPEQLASNAALYTEIVTALTNNELPPQVGILFATEGVYQCLTNVHLVYQSPNVAIAFMIDGYPIAIKLTSDGNALIQG